ncbi:MAG TPA: hypothetical protein DDW36_00870 [Candidatus Magasanikbacteria bacterium]|nr:hypothetical protein [Candidatus Magasanikbacteria bacterium]
MLETSKDLFYIVLSFCVLWFTIFLSWWLFYLAQLTRNINSTVEEVRKKLSLLFDAVDFIREKLGLVAQAASFVSNHFFSADADKEAPLKTKKKKK